MTGNKCFSYAQELWSIHLPLNQGKPFEGPQSSLGYPPTAIFTTCSSYCGTKRWPKLLPPEKFLKGHWNILGFSVDLERARRIPPHPVLCHLCFLGGTKGQAATSTCRVAPQGSQGTPPGSAWAPSRWHWATAAACHHSLLAPALPGQIQIEQLSLLQEDLQTHRTTETH